MVGKITAIVITAAMLVAGAPLMVVYGYGLIALTLVTWG